jgi:putative ABC transport system permease protein
VDIGLLDDPEAAFVPKGFGLALGERFTIWTPAGERTLRVARVVEAVNRDDVVILSLDAAGLHFDRRLDAIAVTVAPGVTTARAIERLRTVLPEGAEATTPRERAGRLARTTAAIRDALSLESGLAVLVTMLLAYQATSITIATRRRRIGIVRACGATGARLRGALLVEALFVGLAGASLGIGLGHVVAWVVIDGLGANLARVYGATAAARPICTWPIALLGLASGGSAMFLGAFAPASAAARATVVSLRHPEPAPATGLKSTARAFALASCALGAAAFYTARKGDVAVVAAFVAIGLGAPFALALVTALARSAPAVIRLGGAYARTAFRRSALACAALAVAAGLAIGIGAYSASYQAAIEEWARVAVPADILVTSGSTLLDREALPFEPTPPLLDAVRASGAAVTPVRSTVLPVDGVLTTVLAVDAQRYLELRRARGGLRVLAGTAELGPGEVFVSEGFAARTGKAPGDSVTLPGGPHARIAAVIADFSSDQGWLLVDVATYPTLTADGRVSALALRLPPRTDIATAARELRAALPAGWSVATHTEVRREIVAMARRTLGLTQAGQWALFVVAIIALGCAIGTSILERRPELRALALAGATRRQIVVSALAEAAIVALAATMVAIPGGLLLAAVLLEGVGRAATGWTVPLAISWPQLALIGGAIVGAAVLVTIPLAAKENHR